MLYMAVLCKKWASAILTTVSSGAVRSLYAVAVSRATGWYAIAVTSGGLRHGIAVPSGVPVLHYAIAVSKGALWYEIAVSRGAICNCCVMRGRAIWNCCVKKESAICNCYANKCLATVFNWCVMWAKRYYAIAVSRGAVWYAIAVPGSSIDMYVGQAILRNCCVMRGSAICNRNCCVMRGSAIWNCVVKRGSVICNCCVRKCHATTFNWCVMLGNAIPVLCNFYVKRGSAIGTQLLCQEGKLSFLSVTHGNPSRSVDQQSHEPRV
jgi:hypothetical protein